MSSDPVPATDLQKSISIASAVPRVAAGGSPNISAIPRPGGIGNVASAIGLGSVNSVKEVKVEDAFTGDVAFNFAFIGSGQGGARLACAFHPLGYRRICLFNTADNDFEGLPPEINRHTLSVGGAAKDMKFAADAVQRQDEALWDLMQRSWGNDPDYVFVCVGLGGGTGSGTAQKLVEVARKYMESRGKPVRVGVIASIPSVTEGQQVCRNAVNSLRGLVQMKVSPLLLVDNAKINAIYRPSMAKLFPTANAVVAQLLHLFNQLAAVHSEHITFDRSELAQLLDNGTLVMGAADVATLNNPADISTAIRENLTHNVLAGVDLRTGNKGACLFVASAEILDQLGLEYFEAGFTQLNRTLRESDDVVVHRGVYVSGEPGLQIYAMVSGLEPPYGTIQQLAKQAGMLTGVKPAVTSLAEFFDL